jgi:hypothetical protein
MNLPKKIYEGRRIGIEDALRLFSWDLIELGRAGYRREWQNRDIKSIY